MNSFSLTVYGEPVGQGSMRHIGGGRMIAANDKELRAWRKAIAAEVEKERERQGTFTFEGAVGVEVTFWVSRKKADKDSVHPIRPYDLDKSARAVNDALSINCDLIANDSQIVELHAWKRFGEPRAEIKVYTVT